ncbi:hypothetical protein J7T55_008872 [Diaporthe amygdali]|uniref:uncharacterized protein n=1 Tax=Phomopsis amygdali TaxID=1214568 RepID=UPI0022FED697|nr:uncharacterized protein J7T55_008872 [Diaporthe amygdali]KAJ0121705.1 hypothetical protein J7T55_008872 [Diaporthe amygdali]
MLERPASSTKEANQPFPFGQSHVGNMAFEPSNHRTVEFYLSSLWSWQPEGRNRILENLQGCELEKADFAWDDKRDWLRVQCLEADKDYVLKEYFKAQAEMESELKKKDMIQDDGSLIPNVENELIKTSRPALAVPNETIETDAPTESRDRREAVRRMDYFGGGCGYRQGLYTRKKRQVDDSDAAAYLF